MPVQTTAADLPHSTAVHIRLARLGVVLFLGLAVVAAGSLVAVQNGSALQVEFDDEVPPGNPVVGSDAPGDSEEDDPNYGLLAVIAIGFIGAGALLIKLEGWERRRSAGTSARS